MDTRFDGEGTLEALLEVIGDDALAVYNKLSDNFMQSSSGFILPEEIIAAHQEFVLTVTDNFNAKTTSFRRENKLLIRQKAILGIEMQEKLDEILGSVHLKQAYALEQLAERSVSRYKAAVADEVGQLTFEPGHLEALLSSVKTRIKSEVSSELGELDQETLLKVATHLNDLMKEEDTAVVQKNTGSFDQLKIKYLGVIKRYVKKYRKKLERGLEGSKNVNKEKSLLEHDIHFQKIQKKFQDEITFDSNPSTQKFFLDELETKTTIILGEVATKAMASDEARLNQVTQILSQSAESYKLAMDFEGITSHPHNLLKETVDLLRQKHRIALLEAKTQMSPIYSFLGDPGEAEKYRVILQQNLEQVYKELMERLEYENLTYKTTWKTAQDDICSNYEATIGSLTSTHAAKLLTPDDLRKSHQNVRDQLAGSIFQWDWLLPEDTKRFEEEVNTILEQRYAEISKSSAHQIQTLQQETETLINDLVRKYETELHATIVSDKFGHHFFTEIQQMDMVHREAFRKGSEEILTVYSRLPDLNLQNLLSRYAQGLENVRSSFASKVSSIVVMKCGAAEQGVEKLIETYTKEMDNYASEMELLDEMKLLNKHQCSKSSAEANLNLLLKSHSVEDPSHFTAVFEQKMQSSWFNILERCKVKSEKCLQEMQTVKERITGDFCQEFREKLAELKEERELHDLYKQLGSEYLQQLESEFPGSNLHNFRTGKESVRKMLNENFTTMLWEFKNRMVQMDQDTRVKMANIEQVYEASMENLLTTYSFVPQDYLQKHHNELVETALTTLKHDTANAPTSKQTEYRELLEMNLNQKVVLFRSTNETGQQHILKQLILQVEKVKNEFFEQLTSIPDFLSEEGVNKIFEEYKNKCIEILPIAVKVPNPESLPGHYEQLILNILNTAVEKYDNLEPSEAQLKYGLREAVTVYCKIMDQKVKTDKHIDREDLRKMHTEAVQQILAEIGRRDLKLTKKTKAKVGETLQVKFQEYFERNDLKIANLEDIAIGIDLGTTFSCVAVYKEGQVVMIPDRNDSKFVTPSYVLYHRDGDIVVGEPAKNQSYVHPQNAIFDAKRLIGRKFNDPVTQKDIQTWPFKVVRDPQDRNQPKIEVLDKEYFPEQISAEVLRKLKRDAEAYLGTSITKAVITVPAYFNEAQKLSTKNAGAMAGLTVLRIIAEPTSAAIAYSLTYTAEDRNVLVYDLGGGTFDVSVLVMSNAKVEVKAVGGNNHLGGEDFDSNMVDFCIEAFQKLHNLSIRKGEPEVLSNRLKRIRLRCEVQKINLSAGTTCRVIVDRIHGDLDLDVEITRDQFEAMNDALFKETIQIVDGALKDAKLAKEAIQDIILVGGSIRIPKVQQLLKDYFNGKNLTMTLNPDEVVARGAAICAALKNVQLSEWNNIQLSDVIPLSLGIEVVGDRFSRIINKNTQVPVDKSQNYFTVEDYQTRIDINVYEGEAQMVKGNNLLGSFTIDGIPSKRAGQEPIDVTMSCDVEGILHVMAVIRSTGKSNEIKIDRGGMSEDQVVENTK